MADAEDEDYHYYGTPLEDEQEGKASAYRRPVKDPAQLRTLPIWKQEATDDQGRKRFHGAFTGGFSAGYYNSVGSAEGFQPASFRSSRSLRQAAVQQSVDDFLDEDEREERARTVLTVKDDYDTFGSTAADAARSAAQRDAQQRPSLIPGPIIEELVVPVADGVGMRLLQKLGWRPGRGVGTAAPSRQAEEAGSKWGTVAGVSLENTPLYVLEPKQDQHGLGYDPFEGAEEFRQAAKRRKLAERGGGAGAAAEAAAGGKDAQRKDRGAAGDGAVDGEAAKRRGRIAFGTGALEDTDTFGYMEDYVEGEYDNQIKVGGSGAGRPGGRGLTGAAVGALGSNSGGSGGQFAARNWERLALSYEVVSGGDSDDELGGPAGPGRRRPPLLLEAGSKGPPPALLQARGHGRSPDSLIPGFLPSRSSSASGVVVAEYFPPPEVPPEFSGKHVFPLGLRAGGGRTALAAGAAGGPAVGAGSGPQEGAPAAATGPPPPPPEVPPPSDPELRKEIEVLAAMVARSGPALEKIARKQAAVAAAAAAAPSSGRGEGAEPGAPGEVPRSKYSFFMTGDGLPYYLWRLHKIQTALAAVNAGPPQQQAPQPAAAAAAGAVRVDGSSAAGASTQRSHEGRTGAGPLTVEQRMAMLGEQPLPVSSAAGPAAVGGPAAGGPAASAPRPQVAEADRQHLQALLSSNFVRGETQDLVSEAATQPAQSGLRLGGKQSAAAVAAAAAFLSRFTGGSSSETAVLQPDGAGGLQQPKGGKVPGEQGGAGVETAAASRQEPVRSAEEWRPEPLLCKRFNVPDPYKGKPPPQQVSRFRTDLLALPETSNLIISPTAASTSLTGPPSAVSMQSQQPPAAAAGGAVAPPAQLPPPPPLPPPQRPGSGQAMPVLSLPPPPPMPPGGLPAPGVGTALPVPSASTVPQLPPPPPLPTHRPGPSTVHIAPSTGLPPPPPLLLQQPQLDGSSVADAATAFLSAFGQSLFAPAGNGSVGRTAAETLPPPQPQPPPAQHSNLPHPPLSTAAVSPELVPAAAGPQQLPQEEDLAVVPLDKPLDLFAAIFEAGSDDDEDEAEENKQGEEEAAPLGQVTCQEGGKPLAGQSGHCDNSAGPEAAAGPAGVNAGGPAKSLAEALMRAQEVSARRAQEAKESRQAAALQEQLLAGGAQPTQVAAAPMARAAAAQQPGGILGPVDPEVQERIRTALSLFQRHHRTKDRGKDRKREKDKKKKRGKEKERGRSKEKDRKSKKDKRRKDRDRERDSTGKGSGKERRSEKKARREKKERPEGKGSKRQRSDREEEDTDGDETRRRDTRYEDLGNRRSRDKEEAGERGRRRKRGRSRSRSRSRSQESDHDRRPGARETGDGVKEPPAELGMTGAPSSLARLDHRQDSGAGRGGGQGSSSDTGSGSGSDSDDGTGSSSSSSDGEA